MAGWRSWRKYPGLLTLIVLELVTLLLVSYQIRVEPHLSLLEKTGLTLIGPIQSTGTRVADYFDDRSLRRKNAEILRAENSELKKQASMYRKLKVELAEVNAENERLREMLQIPRQQQWDYIVASVISTIARDGDHLFTIDKGSRHGLRRDLGVMTPKGVVGIIWEVAPSYAKVMAIENPGTAVAAMIQDSRYLDAYVTGYRSGGRVENVPNFAPIKIGAKVLTSGFDIFPKGLLIGTVTRHQPTSDMFQQIDIKFEESYRYTEEVMVMIPREAVDLPDPGDPDRVVPSP